MNEREREREREKAGARARKRTIPKLNPKNTHVCIAIIPRVEATGGTCVNYYITGECGGASLGKGD